MLLIPSHFLDEVSGKETWGKLAEQVRQYNDVSVDAGGKVFISQNCSPRSEVNEESKAEEEQDGDAVKTAFPEDSTVQDDRDKFFSNSAEQTAFKKLEPNASIIENYINKSKNPNLYPENSSFLGTDTNQSNKDLFGPINSTTLSSNLKRPPTNTNLSLLLEESEPENSLLASPRSSSSPSVAHVKNMNKKPTLEPAKQSASKSPYRETNKLTSQNVKRKGEKEPEWHAPANTSSKTATAAAKKPTIKRQKGEDKSVMYKLQKAPSPSKRALRERDKINYKEASSIDDDE